MDLSLSLRIRGLRASAQLLLDGISNISIVLSPTRYLVSAFSGSATVEARRGGDNVEIDLFPDSGGLLRTAASGGGDAWDTWAAAGGGDGNAYAKTIYDQSGNTNDMVQTTLAAQGQLFDVGGKTVIRSDGVDDTMTATVTHVNPRHLFKVGNRLTAGANGETVLDASTDMFRWIWPLFSNIDFEGLIYAAPASGSVLQFTILHDGASSYVREDGTEKDTGTSTAVSATNLHLWARGGFEGFLDEDFYELILASADLGIAAGTDGKKIEDDQIATF